VAVNERGQLAVKSDTFAEKKLINVHRPSREAAAAAALVFARPPALPHHYILVYMYIPPPINPVNYTYI